ncbi:MAG: flagellar biosynthesis protein FlhF [Planctomycetales bacterium]|nr:flagellar biosynthesis protein FlhF [Planctomycetales bacterium]
MEVHTFRADSLQEALQLVRQRLGPQASVLQTRQRRSGFRWLGRKIIEVDATADVDVVSRFESQLRTSETHTSTPVVSPDTEPRPKQVSGMDVPLNSGERPASLDLSKSQERAVVQSLAGSNSNMGERYRDAVANTPISSQPVVSRQENRGYSVVNRSHDPIYYELLSEMIDSGFEPSLARELIGQACQQSQEAELEDLWLLKGRVCHLISKRLLVSGVQELAPITPDVAAPPSRVIALVGPTGVGKTTTLAKIAAGAKYDHQASVGLITLDTFRLGAVDQLSQYAELISAPLEVVESSAQIQSAIQRLSQCELILLDTAGRAPSDADQIRKLKECLAVARPEAVHLVLSATSSVGHARETFEKFSTVSPTHVLITKLDEAVQFGAWLGLLQAINLPISYVTAGQNVPQDIAVANPRKLASMLLGSRGDTTQVKAPQSGLLSVGES